MSTTWWSAPARWGWRSPTRSSTTPTCGSRWWTGGRRGRALARGVPVRPPPPGLAVLRRRLDGARRRRVQTGRTRGGPERARRPADHLSATTTTCWPTGWSASGGSSCSRAATTSATGRSSPAISGERYEVPDRCRIVDAHYLAPDIPAESPPPFAVAEDARVVPVNDLVRLEEAAEPVRRGRLGQDRDRRLRLAADPRCGSGRRSAGCVRATLDAQPGADPARPGHLPRHGRRDAAGRRRGGVARRAVPPPRGRRDHAAHRPRSPPPWPRPPPSATWELDLLRSIEHVVRLGHVARRTAAGSSSRTAPSGSPTTPWSSTARPTG